jgi:hypothetical protein
VAKKITKQKANEILMGGSRLEPTIDINNYNSTVSAALLYYNNSYSLSDYKEAALEYAASIGLDISRAIPEYNFRSIGAVCRLILRNCTLRIDDIQRTIDKLNQIQSEYDKNKSLEPLVLYLEPVKQIDYMVVDYCNLIEDELIDNILNGKRDIDTNKYISEYSSKQYTKKQSKEVQNFIEDKMQHYSNVYKSLKEGCEQTKESFSNIPSIRIKNVPKTLEIILNDITKVNVEVKKVVTKRKKEISPIIQVKDMPHTMNWEKIDGIHPSNAIGSSEIWVWDYEKRDIHVLKVLKDFKFQAKGYTFLNIDEERSFKKKLRKIEDIYLFTNTLEELNKKSMNETFAAIKTTPQKTSGRMNSSKIIIKIFK